jgi:hypothetical protein
MLSCESSALVAARTAAKANWQLATVLGHPRGDLAGMKAGLPAVMHRTAAFLAAVLDARGGFI